jgi:DNA-binding transcriptional LysR family regulator
MKPVFEVADHLAEGRLIPVAQATPPEPIQMACLYTHRRRQDPKTRLFMEFVTDRIADQVRGQVGGQTGGKAGDQIGAGAAG